MILQIFGLPVIKPIPKFISFLAMIREDLCYTFSMKIYVTRHGQTKLNENHLMQGRIDEPLNERGISQAEEAARQLEGIKFDAVFSSPLCRAVRTASIMGHIAEDNIIKDEKIAKKITLTLPERVENVIKCKNPRCITSTEHYIPHVFKLANRENAVYHCLYCDAVYHAGDQL